jgi:hypothetical protein
LDGVCVIKYGGNIGSILKSKGLRRFPSNPVKKKVS